MTAVEVFQFPATGQQIRTLIRNGEPIFCVADVCRGLQHSNPSVAMRLIDEDDRVMVDLRETDSPNLNRTSINPQMWFVTESGFYALALASQAPGAKAFKRWITHDVLPSLRKTGRYALPAQHVLPTTYAQALRELAATVEERDFARAELETAAPKAEAWDVLASAHGDYSVREAAFILNRDPAISTGQQRLFRLLREWRLIDSNDIPYADHASHVRLRARAYQSPRSGEDRVSEQVRITADGLRYLHKRLGGADPLQVAA
ncbi:BRO family protein [Micromonospora sp. NPDC048986]|uniref:phage antirepressor n=1 Tax=Micromonospora sp. NPDC048986 TaxID=3155644 RepID=UPI0034077F3A